MSFQWEQYRDRYLAERPETFDGYVKVWTADVDARSTFRSWATFSQCANAEPAKQREAPQLVAQAEALMRRNGYQIGPSTTRGGRRWVKVPVSGISTLPTSNRHYTGADVRRALDAFGEHDGLEANKRSAMDVIGRLAGSRATEVSSVYWRGGDACVVAVRFADDPEVNAAEISFGYVWHRDPLPGAEPSSRPGSWYTELPVNRIRGSNTANAGPRVVECPNDPGMMVPVTGECFCGWRPAGDAAGT